MFLTIKYKCDHQAMLKYFRSATYKNAHKITVYSGDLYSAFDPFSCGGVCVRDVHVLLTVAIFKEIVHIKVL